MQKHMVHIYQQVYNIHTDLLNLEMASIQQECEQVCRNCFFITKNDLCKSKK